MGSELKLLTNTFEEAIKYAMLTVCEFINYTFSFLVFLGLV